MVTFTYKNKVLNIYLNGVLDGATTITGSGDVNMNNGVYNIAQGSTNARSFAGTIDEVRMYNRALDPSEVKALYNWAPGPVGYWPMDEGSWTGAANQAKDASGNGINLTAKSNPKTVSGKFGKAGYFNGSSQYLCSDVNGDTSCDDADSLDMGIQDFTISLWAKRSATGNSEELVNKGALGTGDVGNSYDMYIQSTGRFISMFGISGNNALFATGSVVDDNKWHYLTTVFDRDGNMTNYIDGKYDSATSIASLNGLSVDNTDYFSIAANRALNGYLDDVKIYNYARTPSQIIEDMNAGHPAVGTPVGSMVLHLKMDEGYGSTVHDSSPQLNNGTIAGSSAPTWTSDAKFGKALLFDGTDDYVTVPGNISYGTSDSWSASLWLKEQPGDTDWSFFLGQKGTNNESLLYRSTTNLLQFRASDNTYVGGPEVIRSQWNHIVATYSAGTVYLYLNAKQYGPYTAPSTMTFNGVGYAYNADHYFRGTIDDVRIYPFVLSSDQVKTVMNQGEQIVLGSTSTGVGGTAPSNSSDRSYCVPGDTATCSPPVGEWKFEEGVGGTANDSSGNGNVGNFGAGNSAPTWTNGKVGKALKFDGVNDQINVADSTSLDLTNSWTISLWFKARSFASGANYDSLFLKDGAGNENYGIELTGDDPDCDFSPSGGGYTEHIYSTTLTANQWYHLSCVFDDSGNTMK